MSDREFRADDLPSAQEVIALIKKNKRYIIVGVGLVLAVVIAFNSYFQVEPEEEAVVLRFGAPLPSTFEPGLHLKLPFVDQVHKVPVQRQHRLEFGYRSDEGERATVRQEHEMESLMLTGDLELVHVQWSLLYRIDDMRTWLFKVRDQEQTIRDISMSVMRQLVGDYSLHEVLTIKVHEIQVEARRETQIALSERVPTGVIITELAIRNTDVPRGAREAFARFNRTEPSIRRQLNEAKAELDQVTGTAQADYKRAVGEAERTYAQVVQNAEGEATAFLAQWEEYRQAQDVTRQWLYLATITEVFANVDRKVILDSGKGGGSPALNILPLTDLLKQEGPPRASAATREAGR